MDIDHPADLSPADRRVLGLMRLLTHFNTGAILAFVSGSPERSGRPENLSRLPICEGYRPVAPAAVQRLGQELVKTRFIEMLYFFSGRCLVA